MSDVFVDPSPEELRRFTEAMPECRITEFGSVNVQTRVVSRSAGSTYVVDRPSSGKTMTRDAYDEIARRQDEYLADHDMVQIDGWIGNDPELRTRARLLMEKRFANIAGMQQKLYFPRDDGDEPEVRVIYTPGLTAPGYPDDRVIAVDLDGNVTRVLNSDYFGESKKGGLRMWNNLVFDKGGLALHAGLKVIPTSAGDKVFMIIGLSGTGKTTTTFTTQNGSKPIQDDFVGLMPAGRAFGTENGCFAKTFSLDEEFEPSIYGAVTKPTTYLENAYQDDTGTVNFFEESYTQNGRAVFEMQDLQTFEDARNVGPVDYLLDPQSEREHHPVGREARPGTGRRLLHARRDDGNVGGRRRRGGQIPARAGDQPILPAAPRTPGEPVARAPRDPSHRDLPVEHRQGRREGRR